MKTEFQRMAEEKQRWYRFSRAIWRKMYNLPVRKAKADPNRPIDDGMDDVLAVSPRQDCQDFENAESVADQTGL